MADYAIGDVQGCFESLERLLERIAFDRGRDRLWFVGDVVNRGPQSLECLRFVKGLGKAAVTVLGNHDVHLLRVAAGVSKARKRDTLDAVLDAPDREPLLDWLRRRPLFHVEGTFAMVHAGLLPEWSVTQALELAREVETALQGPDHARVLERLLGDGPERWSDTLRRSERRRLVVTAMTRLRMCTRDGAMALDFKGQPGEVHDGLLPWFDVPRRASATHTIVCGHWSALGRTLAPNMLMLDSGCVWGGALSAVRLSDRRVFEVDCPSLGQAED